MNTLAAPLLGYDDMPLDIRGLIDCLNRGGTEKAKKIYDGIMFALGFNVTLRNSRLDEITTLIDLQAGAGFLRIYDGTRPATGGTATTLLAQLTWSVTSFPAASSGAMTANAITDDSSADATGTATWFRVVDASANHVFDGDVGTSGSDLNMNTVSIVAAAIVSVTSFVLTSGNP